MGLHVAGLGAQNISIFNAVRWEEYVSVRQTDCGIELDDGLVVCDSDDLLIETLQDGREQAARCGLQTRMCVTNDLVVSSVPVARYAKDSYTLAAQKTSTGPVVRTSAQPFVAAGDVMLTLVETAGGGEEVVVTRLYDGGNGLFGVGEELTLVRNKQRVAVTKCATLSDSKCYSDSAQAGRLVAPISYFEYDGGRIPAAASEWAVHWAVNTELAVLSAMYDFCHNNVASTTVIVLSSWSPARVWTMKTMRANDLFATGDESAVSYMLVPGFQDPRVLSCTQVSSIRVVAVEFLNTYNVLVTVLEAAPRDVDPAIGDVCETCVKRYRYFYLNPERHDCVEPMEGPGNHFTCWREDQQWPAPDDTAVFGQTCPAAERMPPLGSAVAEIGCIAVWLVRLVLDTVCVIPAALKGGGWAGMSEIMQPRLGRPTFHSMLDTSGANFLSVEEIIRSINRASLYAALSLTRLADTFQGRPGSGIVRNMLTGTAKILQHSDGLVMLGDPISKQLDAIKKLPSVTVLASVGSSATGAAMPLPMGLPSTTRLFVTFSSVLSLNLRILRRMLVRFCRSTSVLDAFAGIFLSAVYESKDDFDTFLDNTRMQCHGLGDILGGTNPWARMIRQACQLGPDSIDFVLQAARVMFVDYATLSCACGLAEGERVDATTVKNICLRRFSPAIQQRWMLELVFMPDNAARRDYCFASMDTANGRLLGAMDPFLKRTYRIAENMAEGLDYLITSFSLDRSGCDSYILSPYVVSLVPEPVDYFMGCMHTFDCRTRCLSEREAFEQALIRVANIGTNPMFNHQITVEVESNLFDPYAIETNENLPPFELFAVLELDVCAQLCTNRVPGRCIAVAGRVTGGAVGLAYYCLPADITMYVFKYEAPGPALLMTTETVVEMMILTGFKVSDGGREWVLVLEEDSGHTRAMIAMPGIDFRTQLFTTADVGDDLRMGFLQVVTSVRVIPAMIHDVDAHVFVLGKRRIPPNDWSDECLHFAVPVTETLDTLATLDVKSTKCASTDVVSPQHRSVCLDRICERELILPATSDAPTTVIIRTWTGLVPFYEHSDETHGLTGNAADTAHTLGAEAVRPIYQIEGRGVVRRAILSPMRFEDRPSSALKFELLACNAGGRQESWINVVHLSVSNGKASAFKSHSTTTTQQIHFQLECSIDTCVGCAVDPDLEAKCYAAQECGVARCAGSIVNMRKPLCSIGKLAAQNMHVFRLALGGMWQAISQQIVLFVELSEARRTQYEIAWPEEAFVAATCQAKDVAVQISAIFTSLAGAISLAERKKQEIEVSQRHAAVDSRVHARFIMTVTSATNLFASIMLLPVYSLLATRQLVSCSVNDAVAVFTSAFAGADASVGIFFGSKRLNEAAQSVSGTCLSAVDQQLLRNVAQEEHTIAVGISNLISGFKQIARRAPLTVVSGVIDAVLSYAIGVTTALQDLLATVDWQSCKLPVVGASLSGSCACGDVPYSIPAVRRTENARTNALWCSGLMMLTGADGVDILIWNPYSLDTMLRTAGLEEFLQCLADTTITRCKAPNLPAFVQQGVELLQVITRCRHNYQRSRWDDAAMLYSLFEPHHWAQGKLPPTKDDDQYTRLRLRMLSLSSTFSPTHVHLSDGTWNCLRKALEESDTFHRCHEVAVGVRDAFFTYEMAPSSRFKYVDACRVFSGAAAARSSTSSASNIPYVWSASSENKVPVALLHRMMEADTSRVTAAEAQLKVIVANIRELFRRITPERLADDLKASTFSVEGDQIHQLVDCIIIGPYAAAAVPPSAGPSLTSGSPLYYRDTPDSRLFKSSEAGHTGGSAFRQRVMASVLDDIGDKALPVLVQQAKNNIARVRSLFLGTDDGQDIPTNLLCTCAAGGASLGCCFEYDSVEDIRFGARDFFDDTFTNLQSAVLGDLLDRVVESPLLKSDIWTKQEFAPPPMSITPEHRDTMHLLQLFNNTHGARTYGQEEVRETVGGKTLWLECMEQLSSPFFTMPLRADGSVDADLQYDPLHETPGEYLHAVERGVVQTLRRARAESPVFWSHVHRYVPTDSAWCEKSGPPRPSPEPSSTQPLANSFMEHAVLPDRVLAPDLAQTVFPSDTLAHCFCGWSRTVDGRELCSVPAELQSFAGGPDWVKIRDRGSYKTQDDLLVVAYTLRNHTDLRDCRAALPSTLLGLLDAEQTRTWFAGDAAKWKIDMAKIATEGPSGIRLAHVGTADDSLWKHARSNATGAHGINVAMNHTIAQPICRSNFASSLRNDLMSYFQDVFFPMAHSVHEPPARAACSRWVVEYALVVALAQVPGYDLAEQTAIAEVWRARCEAQLQQVGACELRGAFDIFPPAAVNVYPGCSTIVKSAEGCAPFFHTPNCLVRCGAYFFDPCVCSDACEFTSGQCAAGRLDMAVFSGSEQVRLLGLHWPATFPEAELEGIDATSLRVDGATAAGLDFETLHDHLADALIAALPASEGGPPSAYCDDLLDYWDPTAQHPMGYHPTMACTDAETNVRGFDAWMSASEGGEWAVDPVRLRNPDLASTAFGASNLVCDAAAYGADAVLFNDLFLNSRWQADSRADPAVPGAADPWSEATADTEGIPSRDPADTPLVAPSDSLLTHTTGLVRDWLVQAPAETWPHWANRSDNDHYASSLTEPVCAPPRIRVCHSDAECRAKDHVCRMNGGVGVCMLRSTCTQHTHCPGATMCAGDGTCTEPAATVENTLDVPIAVQTHARACSLAHPSSHFQNVPNFTRAAGLCKFRNWFQARQLQQNVPANEKTPLLTFPPETVAFLSEELWDPPLGEWLRLEPHVCDRSYHLQQDFHICSAKDAAAVDVGTGDAPELYKVMSLHDQVGNIRMCDIRPFTRYTGFLDPYINSIDNHDSLLMVPRTIKRCADFQICPKPTHRVQGRTVQRRRVLVASADGTRTINTRAHCSYDVEQCWGAGHVTAESCTAAVANAETTCVVDLFVVPMLWVVFGTESTKLVSRAQIQSQLATLQTYCPDAFTDELGVTANVRITDFYDTLARTYRSLQKETVADMSSRLVLAVFGVSEVADDAISEGTDDVFLRAYDRRVSCARYVMSRMQAMQELFADAYTSEPPQTGVPPLAPGTSLYLILNHIPVYVSFSWMWKCGILHAAGDNWLQYFASGIECQTDPKTLNTDEPQSVRDRMLFDDAMYVHSRPATVYADQVMQDLDYLIYLAIYQVGANLCTKEIVDAVRHTLLATADNPDWYRWTVEHLLSAEILQKRSLSTTKVGRHTNDFPYLRFPGLSYSRLSSLLYTKSPTISSSCSTMQILQLPASDMCYYLFAGESCYHEEFFETLKREQPFVQAVNFVLLYIERNMHLIPSFAGSEFNIAYDNRLSQALHEVSTGSMSPHQFKDAFAAAQEYDTFMQTKNFECGNGDADLTSSTNILHERIMDCVDAMQEDGGWIVPSLKRTRISLSQTILSNGFFLSFAESRTDDRWLSNLFSMKISELNSAADAICYMSKEKPEVMNPYWAGDFDFETGCDTSVKGGIRYFDVRCRHRSNAQFDTTSDLGCSVTHKAYMEAVHTKMLPVCADHDRVRDTLLRLNMGSLLQEEVPLCERRPPTDSTCDRAYGTFNNYQGSSAKTFSPTDSVQMQVGVWDATNVLTRGVQGDAASLLALQVRTSDIAGHSLLFTVTDTGGLRLKCLNLANKHEATCVNSVVGWLAQVEAEWQRQHRFMLHRWRSTQRRDTSWHCPLQWLTAYAGLGRTYAAASPCRERNIIRFAHITGDSFYAHPTVGSVAPVSNLRPARFMSDFHSCGIMDEVGCHSRTFLAQTVQRLRTTGTWHVVKHETSSCTRVLDWPHETFTLRDRQLPNVTTTSPCSVYDRLPGFALALQRSTVMRARGLASAPGGVCHMGRLLRIGDPGDTTIQRCARRDGLVRCLGVHNALRTVVDFTPAPPYTPVKPDYTPRRRRCSSCSAGAVHHYVHTAGPRSTLHSTRAMLSTGEQATLSTERVLAAELRRRVCGAAVDCPLLAQVFDSGQWHTKLFMKALLDGRQLVRPGRAWVVPPPASGATVAQAPDDALWARPWAFCTTVDGIARCSGSVPRKTWVDPESRLPACAAAIKSSELHSANTRIMFCLLNSETEELCAKVVGWRDAVQAILCQAAGVCPTTDFFYTPTAYDINNQEFVYDTVKKYYEGLGTSCPEKTRLQKDQIDSNNKLLEKCAASTMERWRMLLYGLRKIKDLIIRLLWYYSNITLNILNLFVAAITVQFDLLQQSAELLIRYVLMFLDAISQVMKELFAAMAQVVFGGGRMKMILEIIVTLCKVVQWIFKNIIQKVMCLLITIISKILTLIGNILIKVGVVVEPAKKVGETLIQIAKSIGNTDFCAEPMNMNCDNLLPDEAQQPPGTLRAPTRCWAAYVTFFGDTQQLSCTVADTCKTSITDNTLVTCGACPAPGRSHIDFGCSAVTKQCTCDVPNLAQTTCTSNSACDPATTSASCQYVDDELQPSTGFVECSTCQQTPFCLKSAGASSGICSCGVFDSPFATCSRADYGSAVTPPYSKPCLYTTDPKYSRARDFKITFTQVMAVPCQDIIKAYCMHVTDLDSFWIVGLSSTGRRLLEHGTVATSRAATCVDAAAFSMRATERACAQACARSRESVAELGLDTDLEPCAFGSLDDLSYALHTHPFLVANVITRPDLWLTMLLRHTPLHLFVNSTARAVRILHRLAVLDELANTLVFNRSEHGTIRVTTTNPNLVPVAAAEAVQLVCVVIELLAKTPDPAPPAISTGPSRRLLFAEVGAAVQNALVELDNLHDSYANQVADIFSYRYADVDTSATRSAWLYDLGPDTAAAFRASPCKVLSDTLALFRKCFDGLEKSYTAKELQATPAASLADAWALVTPEPVDSPPKSQSNFIVAGIVTTCQAFGISPATIYSAMQAVVNELRFSVKCDYLALQTCSKWRMHILHGTVIVGVWFAAWFVFCGVLNLSFLATLTLPFFGVVVMIVTYGYALQCTPMVPVCLFEDMHDALRTVFPRQMSLPRVLLLDSAFCQALAESPPPQCIRACADPPLAYETWYAPAAWVLAELNVRDTTWLAWLPAVDRDAFTLELRLRAAVLANVDQDLITANRLCALSSTHLLVPYLLVAVLLILFVSAIFRSLAALLTTGLLTISVLVASASTPDEKDE